MTVKRDVALKRDATSADLIAKLESMDSSGPPSTLYVSARGDDAAKEEAEDRHKYNDGVFGRVANNATFEQLTMFVIVLNAIAIGWDADYSARWSKPDNLYDGPMGFIVTELFFCVYFTLEILVRFVGRRVKWSAVLDAWFVFDSTLVTMMLVETVVLPFLAGGGGPLGQLGVLRLLRLLRITRMAKLMKACPQLVMLVKGIKAALKAVIWSAILLVILTYTWAIMFTNEYHQGKKSDAEVVGEDIVIEQFFGSMGKSMLSLMIMGTILDDVTACSDAIRATGSGPMLAFFLLYIVVNSFTMLNMVTGILVEVMGSTADGEKERALEAAVRESIMEIFRSMDADDSGQISKREFEEMKKEPEIMRALETLTVRERQFDMYVETLFKDNDDACLSFEQLLDCICQLRPGSMVSAVDLASFKECMYQSHASMSDRLLGIEKHIAAAASARKKGAKSRPPAPPSTSAESAESAPPAAPPEPSTPPTPTSPRSPGGREGRERAVSGEDSARVASFGPGEEIGDELRPHSPSDGDASMLAELEKFASSEIVEELRRRLGEAGGSLESLDLDLGLDPSSALGAAAAHAPGGAGAGGGARGEGRGGPATRPKPNSSRIAIPGQSEALPPGVLT